MSHVLRFILLCKNETLLEIYIYNVWFWKLLKKVSINKFISKNFDQIFKCVKLFVIVVHIPNYLLNTWKSLVHIVRIPYNFSRYKNIVEVYFVCVRNIFLSFHRFLYLIFYTLFNFFIIIYVIQFFE